MPKLSRLRFRFVLPIFVLGLSVLLTIKGDAYRQQIIDRVIAKYGHLEEPMPENVALGRFVSYAISAPAYVAARSIPSIAQVPHWQFLHGEEDWEHSAFLIVLWYIVGRTIDGAANPTAPMIRLPMWFLKAVQVLSLPWGVFMCYTAIQLNAPPWYYAYWFTVAIAVWGLLIILWASYLLFQCWRPLHTGMV